MSAGYAEWLVDLQPSIDLVRENDCLQLLPVLEAHDGEAWRIRAIAAEASIPTTTARRLLFPKVMETRPYEWLMGLRDRVNLSTRRPAAEYTTALLGSYYGQMVANATFLGRIEGRYMVLVNTSQFEILRRIGAKYDYDVTFDSRICDPRGGPLGRARAQRVEAAFRWSAEDRLDPEGYRVTWSR